MYLISYNCKGLSDIKLPYVKGLLEQCDILFLQEHWQLNNGISRMTSNFHQCYVFAKSGINNDELLLGRPYGGVAILIKKTIKCTVDIIDCDSNRVCAILCCFNDYNVLFVNVYMPCDRSNNVDDYNYILALISALQARVNANYIIIGGDLNTDLKRLQSTNTRALIEFNFDVC